MGAGEAAGEILGGGASHVVTDDTVLAGLWVDLVIGVLLVLIFCCLQRQSHLYRYRLDCPAVTNKPPPLASRGLRSYWDWAVQAITASDLELLQSAGLDALVIVKLCALGLQLLAPPCIVGLAVLVPVHRLAGPRSAGDSTDALNRRDDGHHSGNGGQPTAPPPQGLLWTLSLANLPYGSRWMWLHCVLVYGYAAWTMWLLAWHYRQFAIIRQHYVRRGDSFNVWRELYAQQPSAVTRGSFGRLFGSLPLLRMMLPLELQASEPQSHHEALLSVSPPPPPQPLLLTPLHKHDEHYSDEEQQQQLQQQPQDARAKLPEQQLGLRHRHPCRSTLAGSPRRPVDLHLRHEDLLPREPSSAPVPQPRSPRPPVPAAAWMPTSPCSAPQDQHPGNHGAGLAATRGCSSGAGDSHSAAGDGMMCGQRLPTAAGLRAGSEGHVLLRLATSHPPRPQLTAAAPPAQALHGFRRSPARSRRPSLLPGGLSGSHGLLGVRESTVHGGVATASNAARRRPGGSAEDAAPSPGHNPILPSLMQGMAAMEGPPGSGTLARSVFGSGCVRSSGARVVPRRLDLVRSLPPPPYLTTGLSPRGLPVERPSHTALTTPRMSAGAGIGSIRRTEPGLQSTAGRTSVTTSMPLQPPTTVGLQLCDLSATPALAAATDGGASRRLSSLGRLNLPPSALHSAPRLAGTTGTAAAAILASTPCSRLSAFAAPSGVTAADAVLRDCRSPHNKARPAVVPVDVNGGAGGTGDSGSGNGSDICYVSGASDSDGSRRYSLSSPGAVADAAVDIRLYDGKADKQQEVTAGSPSAPAPLGQRAIPGAIDEGAEEAGDAGTSTPAAALLPLPCSPTVTVILSPQDGADALTWLRCDGRSAPTPPRRSTPEVNTYTAAPALPRVSILLDSEPGQQSASAASLLAQAWSGQSQDQSLDAAGPNGAPSWRLRAKRALKGLLIPASRSRYSTAATRDASPRTAGGGVSKRAGGGGSGGGSGDLRRRRLSRGLYTIRSCAEVSECPSSGSPLLMAAAGVPATPADGDAATASDGWTGDGMGPRTATASQQQRVCGTRRAATRHRTAAASAATVAALLATQTTSTPGDEPDQASSLGSPAAGMPRWWTPQPLPALAGLPAVQAAAERLLQQQQQQRRQKSRRRSRHRHPGPYRTLATTSAAAFAAENASGGSLASWVATPVQTGNADNVTQTKSYGSSNFSDLDFGVSDLGMGLALEADLVARHDLDLHRPSVGHRKTVNAVRQDGVHVSVMAQHYAVLVTDVRQPLYGPFDDANGDDALGSAAGRDRRTLLARCAALVRHVRQVIFLPWGCFSWCRLFRWSGTAPPEAAAKPGGGGGAAGPGSAHGARSGKPASMSPGTPLTSTPMPDSAASASETPFASGGCTLGVLVTESTWLRPIGRAPGRPSGVTAQGSVSGHLPTDDAAGSRRVAFAGGVTFHTAPVGRHRRTRSAASTLFPASGGASASDNDTADNNASTRGRGGSPHFHPGASLLQPERVQRALLLAALAAAGQRAAAERAAGEAVTSGGGGGGGRDAAAGNAAGSTPDVRAAVRRGSDDGIPEVIPGGAENGGRRRRHSRCCSEQILPFVANALAACDDADIGTAYGNRMVSHAAATVQTLTNGDSRTGWPREVVGPPASIAHAANEAAAARRSLLVPCWGPAPAAPRTASSAEPKTQGNEDPSPASMDRASAMRCASRTASLASAARTPGTIEPPAPHEDQGGGGSRRHRVGCPSPAVLPMSSPQPQLQSLPRPQLQSSDCLLEPVQSPLLGTDASRPLPQGDEVCAAFDNTVGASTPAASAAAAASGRRRSKDSVFQNGPSAGAAAAAGSPSQRPSARARARWALVRAAVESGAVAALRTDARYCPVSATFSRLFPNDFDRAVPVVNHREIDQLLRRLDGHVAAYEQAREQLDCTGRRPHRRRRTLCGLLSRAAAALQSRRGSGDSRRQHRGDSAPQVTAGASAADSTAAPVADVDVDGETDVLCYHHKRITELRSQVQDARRRAVADTQGTGSYLVFFHTQQGAAMAAQCAIHPEREDPAAAGGGGPPDSEYFKVRPAPGPEEVNWPALWLRSRQRAARAALVRPLMAALLLLVPVGLFSGGLQQLNHLLCPLAPAVAQPGGAAAATAAVWPWYCSQRSVAARALQRLVVAWLPTLLLSLWQGMVLPVTNWLLIQASGTAFSLSAVDHQLAANLFLYDTFNAFLGGVVGNALVQSIRTALYSGPSALLALLGAALPASSNFFLSYLAFRALVAAPLRLLVPHVGIRLYLLRRYCRPVAAALLSCRRCSGVQPGERERSVMTAPVSPRYGFEVGMLLLVFLIGASFAVVAPLLLPVALAVFAAAWLFWRYTLLYVYVRQYESGGTIWPEVLFGRLVAVAAAAAAFSAAALLARGGTAQGVLLLAGLPPMLLRFHRRCAKRYRGGDAAVPLVLAVGAPTASVDPWVYMPPPLHHQALGWHPDWNVPWRGWGLPPYSF